MTSESPLPESLIYLEPVRKQFAKLGPDQIHEDTDLSVLRRAVKKRIKDLAPDQISSALCDDAARLGEWLSTPEGQLEHNARMHFVLPLLPDAIEILFSKESGKDTPEKEVFMTTPVEAKTSKEYGILTLKWKRMHLSLYPADENWFHKSISEFRHFAQPEVTAYPKVVTEFEVGEVKGFKAISECPGFKRVDYALKVPGGFVVGVLDFANTKFDESLLEKFFDSITVVENPKK